MEDETQTGQDSLPGGGQTSEEGKGTSTKTTQTFTEAQLKQAIEKAVSDAESKKGRDWQGLSAKAARVDELEQDVTSLTDQIRTLREAQNKAELDAARDDPDRLSVYQLRQQLRQAQDELATEKRKLNQEKAQFKVDLEELNKSKTGRLAAEIAGKYKGVEPETLLAITDGTAEKMEALAKVLGKPKGEGEKPAEGKEGLPGFDQSGTTGAATGIEALEKANRDFAEGKISEKQLRDIAKQVT